MGRLVVPGARRTRNQCERRQSRTYRHGDDAGFSYFATRENVDQSVGPVGRYSTAEEQAWPLVLRGSPRMSYLAGTVLWTDGGWNGAHPWPPRRRLRRPVRRMRLAVLMAIRPKHDD
jgi:hypothetical protein